MHDSCFLETADRIGTRLCRDALWSGDRCNWLGWAMEAVNGSWLTAYRAQGSSLYDGTAGIALFLGRLYNFTRDALQKSAALGALNHAISAAGDLDPTLRPALYSGATGIAYATIELGVLFNDDRMVTQGLKALGSAAEIPDGYNWLDIIGGAAGAIQVLLEMADRFCDSDLKERALKHGRLLLRTAVKSDRGWSWDTLPGQTEKHLLGYGHGAGGIGAALARLWSATENAEYRDAALESFRYERSYFSPKDRNWPDLRSMAMYGVPKDQPVYAMAWCHGAPGIGLSRLCAAELMEDAEILQELDDAVQTTAAACSNVVFPASGSLCLCHGLGGNADLLLNAAELRDRQDLRSIAENVGHQANLQLVRDNLPWPCGVTGAGETPNLMLGLAGIGHFYLRLYDSAQVPSILLLSSANQHRVTRPVVENSFTAATAQS